MPLALVLIGVMCSMLTMVACEDSSGGSDDAASTGQGDALASDAAADTDQSGETYAPDSAVADTVPEETSPDDTSEDEIDDEVSPDVDFEPHPIGMVVPPFALKDLNPSSATFDQVIDSASLAGRPYSLVFLDSRCKECGDVANGLWEAYAQHPTWWAAQPTFAVERAKALARFPGTVVTVTGGNDLPYLADTEETNLWMAFYALNHDFFTIAPDGTLDVWLELYFMPEALDLFYDHMTERYGE